MVVADELQNGRVVMQSSINANRCLETNITCNNDLVGSQNYNAKGALNFMNMCHLFYSHNLVFYPEA